MKNFSSKIANPSGFNFDFNNLILSARLTEPLAFFAMFIIFTVPYAMILHHTPKKISAYVKTFQNDSTLTLSVMI